MSTVQMLHPFVHDQNKWIYIGVYDSSAKHYKKHSSISGNLSKARVAAKGHKNADCYNHLFDSSFIITLLMTNGSGWTELSPEGPYDQETAYKERELIYQNYEKRDYKVIGNPDYRKKAFTGLVGNLGWGKKLPLKVTSAQFKDKIRSMFDPELFEVDQTAMNDAFLVYAEVSSGKQKYPNLKITTKGDLFDFLQPHVKLR